MYSYEDRMKGVNSYPLYKLCSCEEIWQLYFYNKNVYN
jgi:hypothetical protein